MIFKYKIRAAILAIIFLVFNASSYSVGATAMKTGVDERTGEALRWLPADTQALAFTSMSEDVLTPEVIGFLRPEFGLWQITMLRPLWQLADMRPGSGTPTMCIECVCKLPGPRSDGGNPSCQFLFFSEGKDFAESFAAVTSRTIDVYQDSGKQVKQIENPKPTIEKPDPPPYFLCYAAPGIVIGATNRELMHTVLQRMQNKSAPRVALPETLPEWNDVDVTAPFWGLRHFAKNDLHSPAHKKRALDGDATGMSYDYNPASGLAHFYYYSRSPGAEKAARKIAGLEESSPAGAQHDCKAGLVSFEIRTEGRFPHRLFHSVASWLGDFPPEVKDEF